LSCMKEDVLFELEELHNAKFAMSRVFLPFL
jgi:hypothetical protein